MADRVAASDQRWPSLTDRWLPFCLPLLLLFSHLSPPLQVDVDKLSNAPTLDWPQDSANPEALFTVACVSRMGRGSGLSQGLL